MSEVRRHWEQRAEASSARLSGVLFQGLSDQANAALNEWHAWIARHVFLPQLATRAKVLDLGCGYGRMGKIIASERPDIQLIGQDLAITYCRMFADSCGPCVLADATAPPFFTQSFDGVIAVTSLMYVPLPVLGQTLIGLRSLLRPGGVMLSIDPGYELQHFISRFRRRKSPSLTGGVGFSQNDYVHVFEESGFVIMDRGGNPHLSCALLVPGIAGARASWVKRALGAQARRDCATSGYNSLALHRWLLTKRTESLP